MGIHVVAELAEYAEQRAERLSEANSVLYTALRTVLQKLSHPDDGPSWDAVLGSARNAVAFAETSDP